MQDYLALAKSLATQAGVIMRDNFVLDIDKEWKADQTPLTIADTSINDLVIAEVEKHFPDHGVLGEERSVGTDREYLWVVDPVDGTMPYSHGLPASTFSIALVKDGQPIVAVVEDPFCNRQYAAIKGEGTFLNGKTRLHVNAQTKLEPKVFVDIAAWPKFNGFSAAKTYAALVDRGAHASKSFSAIFNALPVITGQHAGSIVFLDFPWDGAALALLVTEAGGKISDLHGTERRWDKSGDGFIVSNGLVHQEIVDILAATRDAQ